MLGPEDPPLGIPMVLNVLFYSALVWMVLYINRLFRHRAFPLKLVLMSLPLNTFLAASLWFFYMIFSFTLGIRTIGRGHREPVYVDTSRGREAVMVYAPHVPTPLGEVIDYYGEPDEVWFTADSASDVTRTGLLLNWDSVQMFVQLPPLADEPYPVRGKTGIERIIFMGIGISML